MDLKIKDVAELLSVSDTTVRRWLAEGKIPAYRLNRQYRFSRAEIEDWLLKQRMSEQPSENNTSVSKAGNLQFSLYRAIYRGEVYSDGEATTKESVIAEAMEKISTPFELDPLVLTELFLDREKMMATGLGHGIAVPHTRDFLLPTHYDVISIVYPKQPIEYGALDGQPVDTLFFLFACEDKRHLHLLSKIAHLCANEKTRAFFRTKPSKERVLEFVKHWESSLHPDS